MLYVAGSLSFKFAILVAAFESRSSGHSIYYTKPMLCPTLHVFGDTDRVIPKGIYELLTKFQIKMAGYWSFCIFIGLRSGSRGP